MMIMFRLMVMKVTYFHGDHDDNKDNNDDDVHDDVHDEEVEEDEN